MSKHAVDNRARVRIAFDFIIKRANQQRNESSSLTGQDFSDLGKTSNPSLNLKSGEYLFRLGDKTGENNNLGPQMISEIYDLNFLMLAQGVQAAWDYLTQHVIPKMNEQWEVMSQAPSLFSITPHSTIIFDSPLLEEQRHREDIALALNKDEGPLTDAASCFKCGAQKVHRNIKQTRSADEGMTSIFKCPNCKFGWTEN